MASQPYLDGLLRPFAPGHVSGRAPEHTRGLAKRLLPPTKPTSTDGLELEAWSQGFLVGSFIIMSAITVSNMRRGVLLHKLILVELFLGMFHGTFIFTSPPVYGWYLSSTATLLYTSWSLHNVIAWIKTKPFLSRPWALFYIITVILVQPYWGVETYANFAYFNDINFLFHKTRPLEALFRDPWWIFSVSNLFYNIRHSYRLRFITILRVSPRFAVLLVSMILSIAFLILDILSVTDVLEQLLPDGLNPFWKLSYVFKCLTDSIVLDDFKTALDRLMRHKMQKERSGSVSRGDGETGADYAAESTGASNESGKATGTETSGNDLSFLDAGRDKGGATETDAEILGESPIGAGGGLTNPYSGLYTNGGSSGGGKRSSTHKGGVTVTTTEQPWDEIELPSFVAELGIPGASKGREKLPPLLPPPAASSRPKRRALVRGLSWQG